MHGGEQVMIGEAQNVQDGGGAGVFVYRKERNVRREKINAGTPCLLLHFLLPMAFNKGEAQDIILFIYFHYFHFIWLLYRNWH